MHGLMRAVGFRYVSGKKELENILKDIAETGEVHKVISVNNEGENVAEIRKYYSPNMGVVLHGYYNDENEFVREYYFPFIVNDKYSHIADITLNRHMGKTSFAGSCDDLQAGITTIFYLQNGMEFIEHLLNSKYSTVHAPISFAGLSNSGTILLPINKSKQQIKLQRMANQIHRKWVNEAKRGDESAIENLTMEDYDLYSQAVKRVRKDDLLTVVDSSFMPYGVECDHYMIIGEIMAVEKIKNNVSDEEIYYLTLNSNDIELSIAINDSDLTGEPLVGRRFKGSVWLQGIVDFNKCSG